ncbi:MAG: hypothetical protein JSW07_19600, partial [bacterium]
MKRKLSLKAIFLILCVTTAWSQQKEGEIISLSDSIGVEIDPAERDRYHLFPDISGFQSAQIIQLPGSKYRLNYTYQDTVGLHQKSIPLSADALELT